MVLHYTGSRDQVSEGQEKVSYLRNSRQQRKKECGLHMALALRAGL